MSTPSDPSRPTRARLRRRRRVVAAGVIGVIGLGGAIEGVPRIERDLERRVDRALVAAGFEGVSSSFSGQDGTLRCLSEFAGAADAATAVAAAEDVWGVRVAEIDSSCGATSTAADDSGSDDSNSGVTSSTSGTTSSEGPSTTEAAATTTPPDAPDATDAGSGETTGPNIAVELVDGTLVLTGTVADEEVQSRVVDAAEEAAPGNVDDRLVVDAALGTTDTTSDQTSDQTSDTTVDQPADGLGGLDGLVGLIEVMPVNLVSATARWAEGTLTLDGVYVDADAQATVLAAAEAAGATATLSPRDDADTGDATALADELNALVEADPILFERGSAVLTAEANAVVDRVAAVANRFGGLAIEVIGHTDSDGDETRNLDLSTRRARAVRTALLERGVTAAVTATGRGETEPILVGGDEDKAASRRVVFAVETT